MRSAYFPDAEDSSAAGMSGDREKLFKKAPSALQRPAATAVPMPVTMGSSGVSFPLNQSVLWSREATGYPSFLRAQDVIQALYLSPHDVAHLLQQLSKGIGVDFSVEVLQCLDLSESDKAALGSPFLGVPEYMLAVCRTERSTCLTVPIGCRPSYSDRISFDEDSTSHLIQNLGKSITSSREFSLKRCIRIRGGGCAVTSQRSSIPSTGCNSGVMLDGVVRLEAILPDMSFQTVRICTIPIMSTPLSNQLLSKRSFPGDGEGHPLLDKTGYLTMNQTRQLLPLLEDDSCVSHVPVVGLWVKLRPSQLSGASALRHPFCWAACVRYLSTAVVQKRVFVASGTFLLVLITGAGSVECFEVTALPQKTSPAPALSTIDDYLFSDFTINLSLETDDISTSHSSSVRPAPGGAGAVLCRFRPAVTPNLHVSDHPWTPLHPSDPFRANSEASSVQSITGPSSAETVRDSTPYASLSRPAENVGSSSGGEDVQMKRSASITSPIASSSSTLGQSLSSAALPMRSAPGCFSSMVTAAKLSALDPVEGTSVAATPLPLQLQTSLTTVGPTFPAEVIVSQQMQLESLRNEVQELRMLVLRLGGQLPASPTPAMVNACVRCSLTETDLNSKVAAAGAVPEQGSATADGQASQLPAKAPSPPPLSSEQGDDPSEEDWSGSIGSSGVCELLDSSFSSHSMAQRLQLLLPAAGIPGGSRRMTAVNPLNNLLPKMPSTILVTGEGDGSPPLGEGQGETRGSAAAVASRRSPSSLFLLADEQSYLLQESESILAIQAKYLQ